MSLAAHFSGGLEVGVLVHAINNTLLFIPIVLADKLTTLSVDDGSGSCRADPDHARLPLRGALAGPPPQRDDESAASRGEKKPIVTGLSDPVHP